MKLYSIKGRSSLKGIHISGAERIVIEEKIQQTIKEIYKKLTRAPFDNLNIKVEFITQKPIIIKDSLKIFNLTFKNHYEANNKAVKILMETTGLKENVIENFINQIHTGPSPRKTNMRGAIIVNQLGKRVELNQFRGVRTSTVDFENREAILDKLINWGFTERTLDALAISTKNLNHPDIIAEYCISDEPDYLTGYVATKKFYYRLTPLKKKGNIHGGRIYFVNNKVDLKELYYYLEKYPVIIKNVSAKT